MYCVVRVVCDMCDVLFCVVYNVHCEGVCIVVYVVCYVRCEFVVCL